MMTAHATIPLDLYGLKHPDGFFFDLSANSRSVGFHYDTCGTDIAGGADIRYGWVSIQLFLGVLVGEKIIIDYDLKIGKVFTWDGLDNFKECEIGEWLDWFLADGKPDDIQTVCRKAVKQDLESRREALESIDY